MPNTDELLPVAVCVFPPRSEEMPECGETEWARTGSLITTCGAANTCGGSSYSSAGDQPALAFQFGPQKGGQPLRF